ncbi:hypothetical protein ACS386_14250 [Flavobacteriaceae bacterium LMO-SS05]
MRIVTILIFFVSFNLYSQEIEYQLYLKNTCNDSIEKSNFYTLERENKIYEITDFDNPIIKVPEKGMYKLISEETHEIYSIQINQYNCRDTLTLPTIYEYIKPFPPSYKKDISESELKKLRKESRSIFMKCNLPLNGEQIDYFTNGNLRFSGNIKNGFAFGEIKEYYQNGIIKTISIYDNDGFMTKEISYDRNGVEIKK